MSVNEMKVITGEVRGSYVNVFKPREDKKGNLRYSLAIIIKKTDTTTLEKIKKAVQAALERKWGAKPPRGLSRPLRDADAEADADGVEVKPELKGCYFVNVKTEDKPGVVDRNRDEIIDTNEFGSGDYCRVSMNASAFDHPENKGVSFWLNHVQVLREGEPLGGSRGRAENDFDDDYQYPGEGGTTTPDDDIPFG